VGVEKGEGITRCDVGGENNASADVDTDADVDADADAEPKRTQRQKQTKRCWERGTRRLKVRKGLESLEASSLVQVVVARSASFPFVVMVVVSIWARTRTRMRLHAYAPTTRQTILVLSIVVEKRPDNPLNRRRC
jgi:hypothetical protein